MKKIYKTDLASIVNIGFGILLFLALFIFVFNEAHIFMKLLSLFIITFFIFFFLNLLRYNVIISNDSIYAKIPLLSFLNKYQSMKFEEIEEVFNTVMLFPEMQAIFFRSRDKKLISIMVGFGLPWDALLDILERLPKDVKINFEPELWKRIKKPLLNEKVKRINTIAAIVILLALVWFSYFLWCVFKLHRVPFPINIILVNP